MCNCKLFCGNNVVYCDMILQSFHSSNLLHVVRFTSVKYVAVKYSQMELTK